MTKKKGQTQLADLPLPNPVAPALSMTDLHVQMVRPNWTTGIYTYYLRTFIHTHTSFIMLAREMAQTEVATAMGALEKMELYVWWWQ